MDLAIKEINRYAILNKDVVANYVLRPKDYVRFATEVRTFPQVIVTLAPRHEVALAQRGIRELSAWEKSRIQYHYDSGIATPDFGYIIDNSDLSVRETVDTILEIILHIKDLV